MATILAQAYVENVADQSGPCEVCGTSVSCGGGYYIRQPDGSPDDFDESCRVCPSCWTAAQSDD